MRNRLLQIQLVSIFLTITLLEGCGGGGTYVPPSQPVPSVVVAITPGNAIIEPGFPQMFTAMEPGTSNLLAVTWSIQEGATGGSINASSLGKGLYSAPLLTPGDTATYHVVATSTTDATIKGSVLVTVKTLPKVVVSPLAGNLLPGATKSFSAVVTFAQNTAVIWSVQESGGGSITQAGLYTAPASIPGAIATYHVVATSVENPSRSAGAEVTIQQGATPGSWSSVGNAVVARGGGAIGVALADGRVLFAGGWNGSQPFSGNILGSAELYNPATQTFSATGSMLVPRYGATGILLADGRVLVAGGQTTGGSVKTTEVFDPASGTFSAGPTLLVIETRPRLGLLPTGEVLVAGNGTSKMEILNVSTNTASGPWNLSEAHQNGGAAMLQDGRMLIVGGGMGGGVYSLHAEIFDPITKLSTLVGNLSVARQLMSLVVLQNGKVLVMGGSSSDAYFNTVELFDPATGSFTTQASMSIPRSQMQAVLLPNGKVLVAAGGTFQTPFSTTSSEIFDPATGIFTPTASAITPRSYGFLLPLKDGSSLCFGGYDLAGLPASNSITAERYQ